MTERLYYHDAYCTEFTATVVGLSSLDGRPIAQLDQSYFYPTSGGQLYDTGTLGDRRVVDVVADRDAVYHVLDTALPASAIGQPIRGVIDWERRYDHMQQHTGQHLLSQLFYRLFDAETHSVHFGVAASTIDLDTEQLTSAQMIAAEDEANLQVYANQPVHTYFVTDEEVARIPLRKRPAVSGKVRIVEIDQYDFSACGGTHVRHTGELGMVRLLRQERSRGHVRVTFLCGWRALRVARETTVLLNDVATQYSTDPAQAPTLVARTLAQVKASQRRIDELTEQTLAYEADRLHATAIECASHHVIARMIATDDAASLKMLANLLQARPKTIALLACPSGDKLTVIFARSDDATVPIGDLLRDTLRKFGGGGGGRPEYAQGGGVPIARAEALLRYATAALEDQLHS